MLPWHTGGTTEGLHLMLDVALTWASAGAGTLTAEHQATVLPGGGVAANTLQSTWLIVVTVGGGLYLIDQASAGSIDTVLSGAGVSADYATWGRVVDGRVESLQQV